MYVPSDEQNMAASETTSSTQLDFESSNLEEVDLKDLDGIGDARRTNGSELTTDETFELLKNARRRAVIRYLLQNNGHAQLSELAEHIAAAENGISVHELSSDQRKRVYIGLYQCHLPKMDTLGVVEYNKNRGIVELQDSVTQLLPYLETDTEDPSRSPEVVLGSAFAIALVVLIGAAGLGPLAAIPMLTWTVLAIVGMIGLAAFHYTEQD